MEGILKCPIVIVGLGIKKVVNIGKVLLFREGLFSKNFYSIIIKILNERKRYFASVILDRIIVNFYTLNLLV